MNNFDWTYYINKYPDLQKMRIDNKDKALYHYKKFGIKENRFPNKNAEINNIKLIIWKIYYMRRCCLL